MDLDQLRGRLAYQGVLLGVVALAASAALALSHHHTRDAIAEAEARDLAASLVQVLPPGYPAGALLRDSFTLTGPDGRPLTVYRARRGESVDAVVYTMSAAGYAGPISLVMGVDRKGTLLGVRIVRHRETPGLGDKIEEAKSGWVHGFSGKSLSAPSPEQWAVKKDGGAFDQFSGATITPRAVVRAVREGLEFFDAHRGELLGEKGA